MRPRRASIRAVACAAALLVLASGSTVGSGAADRAAPDRVVAIGDLHGDADALLALLVRTGLLDEARRWTGGKATLVQTGDYLDRGTQVRQVLDLLMSLEGRAAASGGRVVVLIGNHEVMNVLGAVRDVSPDVYASFADAGSEARRAHAYAEANAVADQRRAALAKASPDIKVPPVYEATAREAWMAAHPPGMLEYMDAFGPKGAYGQWLRRRPAATRVGDTVFVHGGLDPEVAPKKLEGITDQAQKEIQRWDRMRAYMVDRGIAAASSTYFELVDAGRTELARVAVEAAQRGSVDGRGLPPEVTRHPLAELLNVDAWSVLSPTGPLWFRGFATWTSDEGRVALDALQRRYGPVRFVVGHTPLRPPRQVTRFDGRVFLIDTNISSVYRAEGGRPSALEIRGGAFTAIYLDDRVVLAP
jgi:3',5'-cyclic AMP phosphodiesterase CpdA